jgi:heme/copper-type cytochrome/quinol oxidase subunit 2
MKIIFSTLLVKALGAPVAGQLLFQTPASPYMEGIVDLHHYIMFFLIFISIFVF